MAFSKKEYGDPEGQIIKSEQEPTQKEKLEAAYPHALKMVNDGKSLVGKVREALEKYGSYEDFPARVVTELAYEFGDDPTMIEVISMVIRNEKP